MSIIAVSPNRNPSISWVVLNRRLHYWNVDFIYGASILGKVFGIVNLKVNSI